VSICFLTRWALWVLPWKENGSKQISCHLIISKNISSSKTFFLSLNSKFILTEIPINLNSQILFSILQLSHYFLLTIFFLVFYSACEKSYFLMAKARSATGMRKAPWDSRAKIVNEGGRKKEAKQREAPKTNNPLFLSILGWLKDNKVIMMHKTDLFCLPRKNKNLFFLHLTSCAIFSWQAGHYFCKSGWKMASRV